MPYTAEISRTNPSCFLFLIDQSGSMQDPFGGGGDGERKADELAAAINRLLQNLVIRCAKEEGVRDYYSVGVIGYGATIGPAFGGVLSGREMVALSELGDNPTRVEERVKKISDGAGGLVDQTVKFPVWFDPVASGGTPMAEAIRQAHAILAQWIDEHSNSFPPIVINLTDGEPTTGDPMSDAMSLTGLGTLDGQVLLFNGHLSSVRAPAIVFPDSDEGLADQYARDLFAWSSILPEYMYQAAQQEGYTVSPSSRGFVFNADLEAVIRFLDIGTRPANLR